MKFYDGLNEDDDNSESEDTETESSDGESKDQSSDSPKYPTVVMHCGAQNGFGGNTEDYAFCVYSEDDGEYILGGITTELDLEDLDEDDDMYFYYAVTTRMINEYYDNGIEIGSINAERFNAVLKNAAYGSVKIIQ